MLPKKKLNVYRYIRGVIKKFVDWCNEINTYKAMLANFAGNIKQQLFYQLWNVDNKSFYLQIQFEWYGHPAQSPLSSVTFLNVIRCFPCYSLYRNILWAKYTEVKYQHNQVFYIWMSTLRNFWVKLTMFFTKRRV